MSKFCLNSFWDASQQAVLINSLAEFNGEPSALLEILKDKTKKEVCSKPHQNPRGVLNYFQIGRKIKWLYSTPNGRAVLARKYGAKANKIVCFSDLILLLRGWKVFASVPFFLPYAYHPVLTPTYHLSLSLPFVLIQFVD
jgi:hypothetical protein